MPYPWAISSIASTFYATIVALSADSTTVVVVGIVIAVGNMIAAFLNVWVQRRPRYDPDEPHRAGEEGDWTDYRHRRDRRP